MNGKALKRLEAEFGKFFVDPKINGTADEYHNYEETYCGLWVSCEEGNQVKLPDGSLVPAWSYWRSAEGHDPVHEMAQKWMDEHKCWFEFVNAGVGMIYLHDNR